MGVSSFAASGATFERACPGCGTAAPETARYCMACGAWLDADVAPSPLGVGAEERRTVTVMFADLSGFTAVSEGLDPELLGAVVGGAMRRLAAEVRRFGGRVDKFIGDSVMALFGAPLAHEDDPERALRAALGMQAAMREINDDFAARHGASFGLRVGVNTGEVLAGTVGEAYTVIGDAANTAQRLQAAARPGTITVGRTTVAATRGAIAYRELGPLVLKGKAEPVLAWEAVGLIGAASATAPDDDSAAGGRTRTGPQAGRTEGAAPDGDAERTHARVRDARAGAPLVGREVELAQLRGLVAKLNPGPGAVRVPAPATDPVAAAGAASAPAGNAPGGAHLVTLVGQAGVGKSRLLAELEGSLAGTPAGGPRVRRGRSLPYGNNVVFWPLGEVLRAECGIVDGDGSDAAWAKLSSRVGELLGGNREIRGDGPLEPGQIALIGRLLGVEVPVGVESPSGADAQRMRNAFFATVRSIVDGMARERPLVLAWEDIHWADEGMLDLIEYLAKSLGEPVLLICLARDDLLERRPSWGLARRNATTIFLDPLGGRADDRAGLGAGRGPSPAGADRDGGRTGGGKSAVRRGAGPTSGRGGSGCGGRAAAHGAGAAGGPTRLAGIARAAGPGACGGRRADLLGGGAGGGHAGGGGGPRGGAGRAAGTGPDRPV